MAKKNRKNADYANLCPGTGKPDCPSPIVCNSRGKCVKMEADKNLSLAKKPGQPGGPPGNVTGKNRAYA